MSPAPSRAAWAAKSREIGEIADAPVAARAQAVQLQGQAPQAAVVLERRWAGSTARARAAAASRRHGRRCAVGGSPAGSVGCDLQPVQDMRLPVDLRALAARVAAMSRRHLLRQRRLRIRCAMRSVPRFAAGAAAARRTACPRSAGTPRAVRAAKAMPDHRPRAPGATPNSRSKAARCRGSTCVPRAPDVVVFRRDAVVGAQAPHGLGLLGRKAAVAVMHPRALLERRRHTAAGLQRPAWSMRRAGSASARAAQRVDHATGRLSNLHCGPAEVRQQVQSRSGAVARSRAASSGAAHRSRTTSAAVRSRGSSAAPVPCCRSASSSTHLLQRRGMRCPGALVPAQLRGREGRLAVRVGDAARAPVSSANAAKRRTPRAGPRPRPRPARARNRRSTGRACAAAYSSPMNSIGVCGDSSTQARAACRQRRVGERVDALARARGCRSGRGSAGYDTKAPGGRCSQGSPRGSPPRNAEGWPV